jgi:hypothetical protein
MFEFKVRADMFVKVLAHNADEATEILYKNLQLRPVDVDKIVDIVWQDMVDEFGNQYVVSPFSASLVEEVAA